jgi:tetratricopeptide (TPR) repeat protein
MRKSVCLITFLILSSLTYSQTNFQLKAKADSLYEAGNYKGCIEVLDKLLPNYLNDIDLIYFKASACFYNKQYYLCQELCSRLLSNDPSLNFKLKLLQLRGTSYYAEEKYDLALKDYLSFLSAAEVPAVLNNTAYIYYHRKDYEKCIYYANRAFNLKESGKEDKVQSYKFLGESYFRLAKPDTVKAIDIFQKLIKLDSLDLFGRFYLMVIALRKDDNETAIRYGTESLAIDSTDHSSLSNRAFAYYNMKEYEKCLNDLYKFERLGGKTDALYSTLGDAERKMGHYKLAVKNYLIYLKDDPNNAYYLNELAWVYYLLNDYQNCVIYADKSIKADKKGDDAYDSKGCALYKMREYKEAMTYFNKALELNPDYNSSHYYRGWCHFYLGKKEEACKEWQKLSTTDYSAPEGEVDVKEVIKVNCN